MLLEKSREITLGAEAEMLGNVADFIVLLAQLADRGLHAKRVGNAPLVQSRGLQYSPQHETRHSVMREHEITLFPPQSGKGIHSGGALRRQQARQERDSHE